MDRPYIDTLPRWPHQRFTKREVFNLIALGVKRICVTTPTGGGKSLSMTDVALAALKLGWGVSMFAHRKLLLEQMKKNLSGYQIEFGIRAADHPSDSFQQFQICSVQTEYSRVVKSGDWQLHDAGLILVDEAHAMETPSANEVYQRYIDAGAVKVGFTATPLGLDGCYDELVQAGVTSELRACGALVEAIHHGCTEPDLCNIRKYNVGEDLSEPDNVKAIMVPGIHGRVIDHYRRLNPHGLPSIGFAPGVPESRGFAEAFTAAGIRAAHIDGDTIWLDGVEKPSTQERRDELLQLSRTGEIRIVWNRFVLREAIDMPWLQHGILATVFGSLQSYLQSGGRLLRSCVPAGKDRVVVQDHGGNWWRHGSLNTDRVWRLGDTNNLWANLRRDELAGDGEKEPKEQEPFLCPACGVALVLKAIMRGSMARCTRCGHEFDFRKRSRPVLQVNGELVEHTGNIFKAKRVERRPDTLAKWESMYWRASRTGTMTFNQAAGLFYHEYGYYPPRSMPLMPYTTLEWYHPVKKVSFRRLRPKDEGE